MSASSPALRDVADLFDGERLTLARQLAGYRKNQLAEIIERSPTAVAAYESGSKRPLPDVVGKLCIALSVTPGFFMVGKGEERALTSPHFRSLRSTTQRVRDQAAAYAMLALDVARSIERHVEIPPVAVPSYDCSIDDEASLIPEIAARYVREEFALGNGSIANAINMVEHRGVVVAFGTPQTSSVDAYSVVGVYRPAILLNPVKNDYYRQRFDIAHELGHLVMHGDAEPGSRVAEDQANRFAAELLMPANQISSKLPSRFSVSRYHALKEEWGVSMQALLYRARTLRIMGESTYRNAMVTLSSKGWRRDEPGSRVMVEMPSLLARSVELLKTEGFDDEYLAKECGVPLRIFHQVTARSGYYDSKEPLESDSKT